MGLSGRVAVLDALETPVAVLVLGVAPAEVPIVGLTVRLAAAGVLGEPVRLARELVAAERAELDATESRPEAADGLRGERAPTTDLIGEPTRAAADALAEVSGLEAEAEAEDEALATLAVLVRLTAEVGVGGA